MIVDPHRNDADRYLAGSLVRDGTAALDCDNHSPGRRCYDVAILARGTTALQRWSMGPTLHQRSPGTAVGASTAALLIHDLPDDFRPRGSRDGARDHQTPFPITDQDSALIERR
jgi:hypothetical protein